MRFYPKIWHFNKMNILSRRSLRNSRNRMVTLMSSISPFSPEIVDEIFMWELFSLYLEKKNIFNSSTKGHQKIQAFPSFSQFTIIILHSVIYYIKIYRSSCFLEFSFPYEEFCFTLNVLNWYTFLLVIFVSLIFRPS